MTASALLATRLAVIVGHNFGTAGEAPLRFAEADALRVKEVLVELGDVEEDRVELLLGPSADDLSRALERTRDRVREAEGPTMVIFYFSGHGERTGIHLGSEIAPIDRLKSDLLRIGATTTIAIVDACQNDRAPRAVNKGIERAPAFGWNEVHQALPAGFVLLTSAASGEVAQESEDLQGSLFTHHLVAGLRGAADFDRDGAVTLAEVYHFGYTRTLRDTHAGTTSVQHSEMEARLSGQGAVVLAQPARAGSMLRLADDVKGHLLIVHDGTARILAEVHRAGNELSVIAIPSGVYRVQLRNDAEVRTGLIRVDPGVTTIRASDLSVQPRERVLGKGSSFDPYRWFLGAGVSFGRSVVDGFGVVPAVGAIAGFRIDRSLRLGVELDVGYCEAENDLWRYRQLEILVRAAGDWVWAGDSFAFTAGVRAGAAIVRQAGDRDATQVTDALATELRTVEVGAGPDAAIALGFELPLGDLLALRFGIESGASLIRIDDRLSLVWKIAGGAMGILRL